MVSVGISCNDHVSSFRMVYWVELVSSSVVVAGPHCCDVRIEECQFSLGRMMVMTASGLHGDSYMRVLYLGPCC